MYKRILFILLVLIILAILVFGVRTLLQRRQENSVPSQTASFSAASLQSTPPKSVTWRQGDGNWVPDGTPPPCSDPLGLIPPGDLNAATSVLYPGQIRSGTNYEPGGGFRFDRTKNNAVTIKAAMDATVMQGARFFVDGEVQYLFDLLAPCGLMFRYDHLLTLSPAFQQIADSLPEPKEGDSHTTTLPKPVGVKAGDVLATGVGLVKNNNTFVSWTVFNFLQKNKKSQDAAWADQRSTLEHYAICPYDLLTTDEQTKIKSLPAADGVAGKKSDFCE